MSATNRRASRQEILRQWMLVCLALSLCLSLTLCIDFDTDGSKDSSTTDDLLLNAAVPFPMAPTLLLDMPASDRSGSPGLSTSPIPHPPIF